MPRTHTQTRARAHTYARTHKPQTRKKSRRRKRKPRSKIGEMCAHSPRGGLVLTRSFPLSYRYVPMALWLKSKCIRLAFQSLWAASSSSERKGRKGSRIWPLARSGWKTEQRRTPLMAPWGYVPLSSTLAL